MKFKKKLFIFVSLISVLSLNAEIKMPLVLSDNAILQRNANVKIWGWANPNANVEVEFSGQKKSTKANNKGQWALKLSPMKACDTPHVMSISENGGKPFEIKNVLVGDVWVAGGQSNMEFGMRQMSGGGKEVLENAKKHTVRYFKLWSSENKKTPQPDAYKGSRWIDFRTGSPLMNGLSAVASIFACDINAKTKIPIGVLDTSLSGTNMYSWLPKNVFENSPNLQHERDAFKKRMKTYNFERELAKFQKKVDEHKQAVTKAKAEGKPEPKLPSSIREIHKPRPDSPDKYRTYGEMFNARVYPLKNFTARGFIWYQGENDSAMKVGFDKTFAELVNSWRAQWGNQNMPFLAVQLPSYGTKSSWAEVRWQQLKVCNQLKNMGYIVTVDTGDEKDIHPTNKLPVGHRLANVALNQVYGFKDIVAYAPTVKNVKFTKNVVTVNFSGNIECRGEPRGFEVLCDDEWAPASAEVKTNSIIIRAKDSKKKIDGVRYLWKSFAKPDVCLFITGDLPVAPFIKKR